MPNCVGGVTDDRDDHNASRRAVSTHPLTHGRFGSACWARTSDPLINSQLLYQLS
jgi:hypothetical protein